MKEIWEKIINISKTYNGTMCACGDHIDFNNDYLKINGEYFCIRRM